MLISRFIPIIAPSRLAGKPGGEKKDALYGGYASHGYGDVRFVLLGTDFVCRATLCSCRRPCWVPWPNIWVRFRSAAE